MNSYGNLEEDELASIGLLCIPAGGAALDWYADTIWFQQNVMTKSISATQSHSEPKYGNGSPFSAEEGLCLRVKAIDIANFQTNYFWDLQNGNCCVSRMSN